MAFIGVKELDDDQLCGLDLPALGTELGRIRRAKARLDGYESSVIDAIELMKLRRRRPAPAPEPEAGPDAGADAGNGTAADAAGDPDLDLGLDSEPDPQPAPKPSAKERLRAEDRARKLAGFPAVATALKGGRINTEQADLLIGAKLPVHVVDRLLADAIASGSTDATRTAVTAAIKEHDRLTPEQRLARQQSERRGSWGVDPDTGMCWFYLRTDPVTGTPLIAALDKAERAEYQRNDKKHTANGPRRTTQPYRTLAQRGADLIVKMFGHEPAVDTSTVPKVAGSGLNVLVGLTELIDLWSSGGVGHTLDGTPVPASMCRAMLDTAEVTAWVISATGEPLALARDARVASEVQRVALAIRDGCCIRSGCARSPGRCEAHHLIEWERGGLTDLANLALLCPHHHRELHAMGALVRPGKGARAWEIVQIGTGRVLESWVNPEVRPKRQNKRNGRASPDPNGASGTQPDVVGCTFTDKKVSGSFSSAVGP